ncbi:hypothetical protein [Brevundimonas sp. Bb-A]|jgi:hypothetical protein|uniref:hypothetical protein n=1 Tax=Brevundimonas sp. Bb-A TaxID=2560058 RepID=UPI00128F9D3E|nr:hypothetical protein [Brevundimonas sp. Bb-A]QFU30276.1 hypothetical protein BSP_01235 [Brevundimonas sp. Bb-A]
MNGVIGLDYPAWIAFAQLRPLSPDAADLLSACLPEVELEVLKGFRKDDEE